MKKYYVIALIVLVSTSVFAQKANQDDKKIDQGLLEISNRQTKVAKIGLSTLVGWSVSNMVVGGALQSQSTGQNQYFHRMNFYFNTVNFALGGLGLIDAYKSRPTSFQKVYARQQELEKIYLFNTALDVSYMAVGWGLLNLSESLTGDDRFKNAGYGNSMVLQGGFLFAYDIVMYLVHSRNNKSLNMFWSRMELSQNGLGLQFNL